MSQQRMSTIELEVVRQYAQRYLSRHEILNAEFEFLELGDRIAYGLVAQIAKHRVDHTVTEGYPADWKEAIKEQLLNVWWKDGSKQMRWLRFVPKFLLRKFVGDGVRYKRISVTAEAFYPHLPIGPSQERVVVRMTRLDDEYNPWTDGRKES